MAEEIRSLQSRIGNLQDQVRLTDVQSGVSDLDTSVNGLVQRLATVRTRGYVFGQFEPGPGIGFILGTALPKP